MIPKIIHYCWFGGKPLPKLAQTCIASWVKHLPDYEIKEWNESNFPFEKYPFAKEALAHGKFAFVSDVCRLHGLKEEGGIYMDTDVEVLKPLDSFLHHAAFSGFENDDYVPTGIMASEKSGSWVTELLAYYNGKSLFNSAGVLESVSNTSIITKMMKNKGFVMNNSFQEIKGYVAFYPSEYFCPKSYKTGNTDLTENSHCIHHFAKSWIPFKDRWKNTLKMKVMNLVGAQRVQSVIDILNK